MSAAKKIASKAGGKNKAPAVKAVKSAKAAKTQEAAKARTKSELITGIAEKTGLARKDVGSVFELMTEIAKTDLSKKGPGIFTVPGLCKLKTVVKPARPSRKGVNPFTGEEQVFKAKPATNVVKIRPLKALKEAV